MMPSDYRPNSDDDWCPDCGESRPCSCDDMEADWFEDGSDEEEAYEQYLEYLEIANSGEPMK